MKKMLLCIIGSFLLAGLPLVATADVDPDVYPNVIRGWDTGYDQDYLNNNDAYQAGIYNELHDACTQYDSTQLGSNYNVCLSNSQDEANCYAAGVNDTADKYGRHPSWQMYFDTGLHSRCFFYNKKWFLCLIL